MNKLNILISIVYAIAAILVCFFVYRTIIDGFKVNPYIFVSCEGEQKDGTYIKSYTIILYKEKIIDKTDIQKIIKLVEENHNYKNAVILYWRRFE